MTEKLPDLVLSVHIEEDRVDARLINNSDGSSIPFSAPIMNGSKNKLEITAHLTLSLIEHWKQIQEDLL